MTDATPEVTAEQAVKEDYEKRATEFMRRYGELVKELNIDIAAYPVYIPDGHGSFSTTIQQTTVDIKNKGAQPSPFVG